MLYIGGSNNSTALVIVVIVDVVIIIFIIIIDIWLLGTEINSGTRKKFFCQCKCLCYVRHGILSKRRDGRILFHFCSAFKTVFFHKVRKTAFFTVKKNKKVLLEGKKQKE